MKLNITDLSYDAKEYEHRGAKLQIRPFPSSMGSWTIKDGGMVIDGENQWELFDYCLVGWDCTDDSGALLECNAKTKKLVFDFALEGIPAFVTDIGIQVEAAKDDEEKN